MRITYYISFAVCAAVIGFFLRSAKSSTAQLLGIGAFALMVFKIITDHASVISSVSLLMENSGFSEYGSVLIKALGIAAVCSVGGEVCRDLGEGPAASALELAGKIEIVALALPIAADLLALARGLVP